MAISRMAVHRWVKGPVGALTCVDTGRDHTGSFTGGSPWPSVQTIQGVGSCGDRLQIVHHDPAVLVADVVRVFTPRRQPEVRALDSVSLSIPRGEVHGLLGPNGAGKTTLVKILCTVLLPTDGRAFVCGHDVVTATKAVRPLIGIVFGGERGLYTRLSARQNLEYWGALYRLSGPQIKERTTLLLQR